MVITVIQAVMIVVIQMTVITELLHSIFLLICAVTIKSSRLMDSIALTAITWRHLFLKVKVFPSRSVKYHSYKW